MKNVLNEKLKFLCFQGTHNSLPSFWAKLGYSWIKIDLLSLHVLYSLQFKTGVHLLNDELTQLPSPLQINQKTPIFFPQSDLLQSSSLSFSPSDHLKVSIHFRWLCTFMKLVTMSLPVPYVSKAMPASPYISSSRVSSIPR